MEFSKDLIRKQLSILEGSSAEREGLEETPSRVVRSWEEIYSGYDKNPKDVFTVFDNPNSVSKYDGIVISGPLKVYSMCEHHMLPFFGRAWIGYVPDKKVIGVSKLSRLLRIYTRRLQIQERINTQVVNDLMTYLAPKGAICLIEASHMCMRMRGVDEDASLMKTISATGIFLEPELEMKFINLIK